MAAVKYLNRGSVLEISSRLESAFSELSELIATLQTSDDADSADTGLLMAHVLEIHGAVAQARWEISSAVERAKEELAASFPSRSESEEP